VAADPALRDVGRLRWAATEQMHLTLRFLGATPAERVADAAAAVEAAASSLAPFPARIGGAGAFPAPDRPRVVWLGITEGAAGLATLAGRLADELARRGWEGEGRPFRAHLTLARADGIPGAGRVVAALAAAAATLDAAWSVDRLVLYESRLGGGPPRYRPLATASLRDDG
jgi:2'-5' RNA ligase